MILQQRLIPKQVSAFLANSQSSNLALLVLLQTFLMACSGLAAAKFLGPEGRGLLVLGLTVGTVLAVAGSFGIGVAYRAVLPKTPAAQHPALNTAFFWLAMATLAGTAAMAACIGIVVWPGDGAPGSASMFSVALGLYAMSLVANSHTVASHLAHGLYRRAGLSSLTVAIASTVAVGLALATDRNGCETLLWQAVGAVIAAAIQLFRTSYTPGMHRIRAAQYRALLGRSIPTFALTIAISVALRADRLALGVIADPTLLGIYALASTVSELPRILSNSVGDVYMRDVTAGNSEKTALFNSIRRGGIAVGIAALGLCACVLPLIVPVFGREFSAARPVLPILLLAELMLVPYIMSYKVLFAIGSPQVLAHASLVSLIAPVAIAIAAATNFPLTGVAIGSALAYAALSAISLRLALQCLDRTQVAERDLKSALLG